ncbi:MAG TPA: GNAT family N-acetyltransferase [Solirubrobacteraceae bacterium]|nr:GNAT family N-acetyltransferase [Solirubrobacteraceae bacterium]
MTVRVATPADARAVAQLLHDFNEEFEDPTPGPDALAERLTSMLGRDDVVALLAGDGPDGVALLTFRPGVWDEGPVALLEELYVKPGLRNRGIGTELLQRAFDAAREKGSRTFEINVDEEDVDAQRFYERHGVTPIEPGREYRAFYYSRRL